MCTPDLLLTDSCRTHSIKELIYWSGALGEVSGKQDGACVPVHRAIVRHRHGAVPRCHGMSAREQVRGQAATQVNNTQYRGKYALVLEILCEIN